jgi:hypothetical protein
VRGSNQSRGHGGVAAQSDGLCITCIVTRHMLSIDSQCVYIYTHTHDRYILSIHSDIVEAVQTFPRVEKNKK